MVAKIRVEKVWEPAQAIDCEDLLLTKTFGKWNCVCVAGWNGRLVPGGGVARCGAGCGWWDVLESRLGCVVELLAHGE